MKGITSNFSCSKQVYFWWKPKVNTTTSILQQKLIIIVDVWWISCHRQRINRFNDRSAWLWAVPWFHEHEDGVNRPSVAPAAPNNTGPSHWVDTPSTLIHQVVRLSLEDKARMPIHTQSRHWSRQEKVDIQYRELLFFLMVALLLIGNLISKLIAVTASSYSVLYSGAENNFYLSHSHANFNVACSIMMSLLGNFVQTPSCPEAATSENRDWHGIIWCLSVYPLC